LLHVREQRLLLAIRKKWIWRHRPKHLANLQFFSYSNALLAYLESNSRFKTSP